MNGNGVRMRGSCRAPLDSSEVAGRVMLTFGGAADTVLVRHCRSAAS